MMDEIKRYFKEKRIGFLTNTFNPELLEMSTSLYREIDPDPVIIPGRDMLKRRFYGYKVFDRALRSRKIGRRYDYLIYMDEDCFVVDPAAMFDLVKLFVEGGYDFCGAPDCGVINHRFHNPVAINTFFCIFNLRSIKKIYNHRKIEHTVYAPDLERFTPRELVRYPNVNYDDFEPYYRIFFYLLRNGARPLYLDAKPSDLDDGITTELVNQNGKGFCVHTWYAREFATDPEQRERIISVFNGAAKWR
jgi:hypothetical protein